MHFDLISFMHSSLSSIRELIGIIASNYWWVDYNLIDPVTLFRSPVFHDTFWTNKVSLSYAKQSIFYVFNCLHFISLWWFSDTMTIEDRKIMMRDRCIKCGDMRHFFSPPSMDPLAWYFGFVSFDQVCDFFLLMVFIWLCRLSSISFFWVFFLVFFSLFQFKINVLVIFFNRLVLYWFFHLYRLTIFLLPPHG